MRGMENIEQNQPLTTEDVLEMASVDDLKYLAAIGLKALVSHQAAGDDELDGGDFIQGVGWEISNIADLHAPRPEFLPAVDEGYETNGEVWQQRFDFRLWRIG